MTLFSSKRERHLWALTLVVMVAIYSTLGLAATLAGALRDSGLIEEAVFLSMILVVATIVMQGLKTRPGGVEIGVALGIAAVYLLLFLRMAAPLEERPHLMEYGVVAVFIYEASSMKRSRSARQGRSVPIPALLAALVTSLLEVLDECIQVRHYAPGPKSMSVS